MRSFKTIRVRAAKRKGGDAALVALLPKVADASASAKLTDDRALSQMAKRTFSAGFVWNVVESKWSGFEAAFLGFEPKRLARRIARQQACARCKYSPRTARPCE